MKIRAVLLAAGLGLAAAAPAAPPADPLLALTLTGRSAAAKDLSFSAGAGRYVFPSANVLEVADADGRAVGVWVIGEGGLSWFTDDSAAMKVYRENAGRVGGFEPSHGGAILAELNSALVLFTAAARPEGLPELGQGAVDTAQAEELGRFLARWADDLLASPGAGLAAGAAEGRRFFVALLAARKDVRHEVNEAWSDLDTLTVVEKPVGLPASAPALRVGRTVATQPLGRSRREPPRADWVLEELSVDVRETSEARGLFAVEERIVPARPLTALVFDLDGGSWSPRLLRRRETRELEVSLADGTRLPYLFSSDTLVVILPKAAEPGAPLVLRFRYDAPYFERRGDNYWELPLGSAWYPRPVALGVQARHGMTATVRAKKPLVPIAPGTTRRRFEDGEWNGVEARIDTPAPFHAILAGKYTFYEESKDGVTARVATYGLAKPASASRLLALFHTLRAFYENYHGPFPWPEYTIVEVNDYGFGQAPPGLMRITREAFEGNKMSGDVAARVFSEGVNQRFAHEVAHAWWGGVVWNALDADVWLVEAFAQMASARALEMMKDVGEYDRVVRRWKSDAKGASARAPIPLAGELVARAAPGAGDSLYEDGWLLVYAKGPTLLAALRRELGDGPFFTAMKSLLKSFRGKRPALVTADFAGLLGFMTKRDWQPWFERYYHGTEVP
jgi:hypothetical protein